MSPATLTAPRYVRGDIFDGLLADFRAVKQHLEGGAWAFADKVLKNAESDTKRRNKK